MTNTLNDDLHSAWFVTLIMPYDLSAIQIVSPANTPQNV